MRILIVTVFFPPKNSIASLRPYSWAKHFARLGHEVTVLTTKKLADTNETQMPCDDFQVIEVGVPGMSILSGFLGSSRKPAAAPSINDKSNILTRIKQAVVRCSRRWQQTYGIMYACRMPEIHDLWLIPASRRIPSGKWDLVITTAWPYSVHVLGWLLKRTNRTSIWIADWRDLWTENHLYPGWPVFRSIERWLERLFNNTADCITTVSAPLATSLNRQARNRRVEVIYNGYDEDDYRALPSQRIFPDDDKLRIVYTGTIYPGKRDPSPLFAAIARLHQQGQLSPDKIELLFASKLLDVHALAAQMGVAAFVSAPGFLPRPTALRMQRDADALLFLEFEAPGVEGILTGKLFEYLHAGPPVLALGVSPASTAGALIQDTGKGWALGNDVDKICEWLAYLAKHGEPPPAPPAQMDIHTFSREFQAKKLLELIP
jgi:glycosyltransferase involved in cell wall biosynthesis